jgi:hypothetical protein
VLDPGRSVREALAGPSWKPSPRFAYLATGVVAAVAGLLFLIGGIFFGQARFGFTLAGAVLLMVAIPLLWLGWFTHARYVEAGRLRSGGVAGTATVVGVGHARMGHLGNPLLVLDLVVEVEGRPSYRTRVREYVPADRLEALARGDRVDVVVDPDDPSKVVVAWPPAS